MQVLTQYKARSLDRYIKQGWNVCPGEMAEYLDILPPQQRDITHWYQGTSEAVFQNLYTLQQERPELMLILGGDHIDKMDYSEMIAAHLERGADVTIACTEVPRNEATRFGVMGVDANWRVQQFTEKPAEPDSLPDNPELALASMGIYVFTTEALVRALMANARQQTGHDFGKHIIPQMIQNRDHVYAYPFRDRNSGSVKYWRDIGTLDSDFDANMDLIAVRPLFNLSDQDWPIRTYQPQAPPAKMVFRGTERQGEILDSLVSNGCIISGGRVEPSILSAHELVHSWAHVEDCVVIEDVEIGRHARIRRAIIDKGVKIPAGEVIGYDLDRDRQRFTVTENGIVVIPKDTVVEPS